jgi:hypothetical protein
MSTSEALQREAVRDGLRERKDDANATNRYALIEVLSGDNGGYAVTVQDVRGNRIAHIFADGAGMQAFVDERLRAMFPV